VKLPDIMKAKKKPLETLATSDLADNLEPQVTVLDWSAPPKREKGVMVSSVDELLAALKDKGLVA